MSFTPDPNSWGDYLATPPNMVGTPPDPMSPEMSNLPPPFSPIIPEVPMQELFVPTQMIPQPQPQPQTMQPAIQKNAFQPMTNQNYPEFGELENRSLLISNANPATTEEDIRALFSKKGDINRIDLSQIESGKFIVHYFDIRSATSAKMFFNGIDLKGYKILINFAPLPIITDPKKPPNNGTIVIFHLPVGITDDQIMTIFGQFGEIRQIRGTPTKSQQRFVEYWDTRDANAALLTMSGKFVMGLRVSIEFSLPGGFRKGIQKVETPHSNTNSPSIQKPIKKTFKFQ